MGRVGWIQKRSAKKLGRGQGGLSSKIQVKRPKFIITKFLNWQQKQKPGFCNCISLVNSPFSVFSFFYAHGAASGKVLEFTLIIINCLPLLSKSKIGGFLIQKSRIL